MHELNSQRIIKMCFSTTCNSGLQVFHKNPCRPLNGTSIYLLIGGSRRVPRVPWTPLSIMRYKGCEHAAMNNVGITNVVCK